MDDPILQVSGVEMDDAISIARNLVEYTIKGTFRQRQSETLPALDPYGALAKSMVPMERSDGG